MLNLACIALTGCIQLSLFMFGSEQYDRHNVATTGRNTQKVQCCTYHQLPVISHAYTISHFDFFQFATSMLRKDAWHSITLVHNDRVPGVDFAVVTHSRVEPTGRCIPDKKVWGFRPGIGHLQEADRSYGWAHVG